MTDAPKKRPWFQIHLSTSIVLMFVAGGLVWANVSPIEIVRRERRGVNEIVVFRLPQWPFGQEQGFCHCPEPNGKYVHTQSPEMTLEALRAQAFHKIRPELLLNIMTCGAILIITCASAEYILRRRERRRNG